MKRLYLLPFIGLFILLFSCTTEQTADVLVRADKVYTVDSEFSVVESFAIKDGKILEAGTWEDLSEKYDAKQVLDYSGAYIYPGLIDPHCHFYGYSTGLLQANLVGTTSVEAIIERLKEHQETYPSKWILGRGWDQNDWKTKEFPTKEMLDEAFPETPVFLKRVDGHAAWVNSKALELAGVTAKSSIQGGDVMLKDSEPQGILVDNASTLVSSVIPAYKEEETAEAILQGQENCFAVGLTSVADAGLSYEQVMLLDSLQKNDQLKMRIYAMLSPSKKNIEQFVEKGPYETDFLHIESIKLFADGALGSRGACMLDPYSDDPDNYGLIVTDIHKLDSFCELAYENNFQVNTHAIGDSANRLMLKMYAKYLGGANDRRWRIEHAQVIHRNDFQLFGQYDIIPSIQTTHATSDMYWADERLGTERLKGAYAYQELLVQNGWLPNGSDFPVEHINPLLGFYAAIARKDVEGYPSESFQMENALSREQALKGMTIWAAKAAFEEDIKGSLEPGKMADFVVFEKDLMHVDEKELPGLEVLKTISGGAIVYQKQ